MRWLVYWISFAALSTAEFVLAWVPFYYYAKVCFAEDSIIAPTPRKIASHSACVNNSQVALVLWLISPQTQGAQRVLDAVLRPLFKQHEGSIDPVLQRVGSFVADPMANAAEMAREMSPQLQVAQQYILTHGADAFSKLIAAGASAAATLPPPPAAAAPPRGG